MAEVGPKTLSSQWVMTQNKFPVVLNSFEIKKTNIHGDHKKGEGTTQLRMDNSGETAA